MTVKQDITNGSWVLEKDGEIHILPEKPDLPLDIMDFMITEDKPCSCVISEE